MMQDDNTKIEDDEFMDDLGDDLDLDALDVEDDEFDLDENVDEWDDLEDTDDASAPSSMQSKPSFLKKNFNIIVGAIVVVGGGLVLYGQFGGAPASPQAVIPAEQAPVPYEAGDVAEHDVLEELPDLSSDLVALPLGDVIGQGLDDVSLTSLSEDSQSLDALTPMPSLGADLEDDLALDPLFDGDEVTNEHEIGFLPDLAMAVEQPAVFLDEEPSVDDLSLSALPELELPIEEPAPVLAQEAPIADSLDSGELEALQLREEELLAENAQKTQDIEAANMQISSLEKDVSELNAKISSLNASLEALRVEKDNIAADPARAVDVKKDVPKPVLKVEKSIENKALSVYSAPKVAVKDRWSLRSAQPGRAVLSDKTTQDMHVVELGDVLDGLGKIRSISVENGLWVVRGNKGHVSQ